MPKLNIIYKSKRINTVHKSLYLLLKLLKYLLLTFPPSPHITHNTSSTHAHNSNKQPIRTLYLPIPLPLSKHANKPVNNTLTIYHTETHLLLTPPPNLHSHLHVKSISRTLSTLSIFVFHYSDLEALRVLAAAVLVVV